MIDYNKLKIAHELILKVNEKYGLAYYAGSSFDCYHRLYALNSDYFEDYKSIDELIEKLESLIKPELMYKVGDTSFTCLHGEIQESKVQEIYWDNDLNDYRLTLIVPCRGKISVGQSFVYPTREDLIESQIDYWSSMLEMKDQIKYWAKQAKPILSPDLNKLSSGGLTQDSVQVNQDGLDGDRCQHEYTFLTGFRCVKCDYDCTKDIKPIPCEIKCDENCSKDIQSPVECDHEEHEEFTSLDGKIRCGKCNVKLFQECEHESDGRSYVIDERYDNRMCTKCGEFY